MALKEISRNRCFGGLQKFFEHSSVELKCKMRFAVYLPPQAESGKCPALYWLSGKYFTFEFHKGVLPYLFIVTYLYTFWVIYWNLRMGLERQLSG